MSSTYTGARAIASSTNASPIAVTFAAAHGLTTGAQIIIAGHLANTSANGIWTVTVTGGTTLTLNGSTGVGVGGATGNAYTFPTSITEPSDGDARNASSVNAPLSGLADCVAYLLNTMGRLVVKKFTTAGAFSFLVPPNVNQVILWGCGGGGGGGGGARPDNGSSTTKAGGGGGGGGGAIPGMAIADVTPGATVTGTIGGGGTGGNGGTSNNSPGLDGNAGTDTTFGTLIDFAGAGQGHGAFADSSNQGRIGMGGSSLGSMVFGFPDDAIMTTIGNGAGAPTNSMMQWRIPQYGGNGATKAATGGTSVPARAGMPSPLGLAGGTAGSNGTDSTGLGGLGGGGGGGGVFAPTGIFTAGAGGPGGNGSATTGTAGTAGTSAANVFGAGGGGGGGGGNGATASGNGGNGGNGTGGFLWVAYVAGANQ